MNYPPPRHSITSTSIESSRLPGYLIGFQYVPSGGIPIQYQTEKTSCRLPVDRTFLRFIRNAKTFDIGLQWHSFQHTCGVAP